jgi:hypothetical protein
VFLENLNTKDTKSTKESSRAFLKCEEYYFLKAFHHGGHRDQGEKAFVDSVREAFAGNDLSLYEFRFKKHAPRKAQTFY